jgi:hypothetical protein
MKVEEVSDAEEEEGPVPITFLKIKADPEVRCMSLNVHGKIDLKTSKNASCLSDFHLNVWLAFAELFLRCLYTYSLMLLVRYHLHFES